jgi:hypothetical protein
MDHKRKMRVKLTSDQAIYIHNDLSNAAFYFKNRIAERLKQKDHEGIYHEMLAGLTMTAFAMEANINFIGDKVVGTAWNEREAYWKKVKLIFGTLKINADFQKRPYSSIEKLQKLRDALAHGKPERVAEQKIVVGTYDELEAQQRQSGSWEKMVTVDNVMEWFDDIDAIWKGLLIASKIEVFDTMDQGMYGMEFIEFVDD